MECRDYKKRIPAYLAAVLAPEDQAELADHLACCPECRYEMAAFHELDRLIEAADMSIPPVPADLTASILRVVKVGNGLADNGGAAAAGQALSTGGRRKHLTSLLQDLVTAAAAAIIIFWLTAPVLDSGNVPSYSKEVVKVSTSVGEVFEGYMDFSASTLDKFNQVFETNRRRPVKGDE